ncbi:MAG: hypothetical protein HYU76_00605 [Betaproteobacteria bacterium]|nr:hypothetical protein [Betaproteobacteria bacterium]
MNYRSTVTLLGLPLVHIGIGTGQQSVYKRGIARGWIAIGDIAFGVVAIGGVACGVIAFGGIAIGAVAIAGLAVGSLALAGAAFGVVAVGGAALASHAALGGLAVATDYAVGGLAIAAEANTPAARAFFDEQALLATVVSLMDYAGWLLLLLAIPLVIGLLHRRRDKTGS